MNLGWGRARSGYARPKWLMTASGPPSKGVVKRVVVEVKRILVCVASIVIAGGGRPGERGRPTSGSGNRVGEAWGANAGGSPGGGGFGMDFGVMGVEGALGQSGRASREVSGFPRSPGVKLKEH